jgi:hypothetical protein
VEALPPQDVPASATVARVTGSGPGVAPSIRVEPGALSDHGQNAYMKDYVTFADVYWKLNWMRKELLRGSVPYNLLPEIEKARRELHSTPHDGNYIRAAEALDCMRKGLEHAACLQTLQAAHIDEARVPWDLGSIEVRQAVLAMTTPLPTTAPTPSTRSHTTLLDDDLRPHPELDASMPTPTPNAAAVQLALDYAERYHVSPREMIGREWERAIRLTNRLRDQLHLQNRPQNDDGDSTDVHLAVAAAALNINPLNLPAGAGQAGVAPDEVPTHF